MIKVIDEQCSRCGQGTLMVMYNLTDNNLYIHCGECEAGWVDPKDRFEPEKSFLAVLKDFEARFANFDDVSEFGWNKLNDISFKIKE